MERENLIYDWAGVGPHHEPPPAGKVMLDDETLRDGLQCPSVKDPTLDKKIELVHLMNDLGINSADIGLPGAGRNAREHILAIAKEMKPLRITPNVACRTMIADIEPVVDMVQQTGAPIEVCAFIGSSPIRAYAENWDIKKMVQLVRDAVRFAKKNDLPLMFVTEDTVRSTPEILDQLNGAAIDEGADRLCICDTVGGVIPYAVRNIFEYVQSFLAERGATHVGLDWHGHRDRGLGVINTLSALAAGAERAHATALGIGERAGNTEMDLLLVNLKLLGWVERDLTRLGEYVKLASEATGRPVRPEYPVFGEDAFETATGVHAAAVIKALKTGDRWLSDLVYSGVPAGEFGLEQVISVGPMSGKSNVIWFLEQRGHDATEERITAVLAKAKASSRLLTEEEVLTAAGVMQKA
ncbi:MAG: 2-isopropylmalate synthase [Planctomycetes bacterium]|nr:2-isopropylmalate synthase [Planctomycetota bacterium]MCP4769790.1 2-isopropylmalate synthase [Planctomycetota bacterium]MCP4859630.1 2-isopropylmalate synthase [Planctomycetota bacterium]